MKTLLITILGIAGVIPVSAQLPISSGARLPVWPTASPGQGPQNHSLHGPYVVASGDLNGDGLPEVVSASSADGTVAVFWNQGGNGRLGFSSTFSEPELHSLLGVSFGIRSLVIVDLDGDGDQDIAFGAEASQAIGWLENDGAGLLTIQPLYTITSPGPGLSSVKEIDVSDVDGDGSLDILFASTWPNGGQVGWLSGATGWSAVSLLPDTRPAWTVDAADLNGDGHQDLVVGRPSVSGPNGSTLEIYLGDSQGQFTSLPNALNSSIAGVREVAVGDINGDGQEDVVGAFSGGSGTGGGLWAWVQSPAGGASFEPALAVDSAPALFRGLCLADLDGDQDLDVVGVAANLNLVACYENSGGLFGPRQTLSDSESGVYSVCVSDLDGDGDLDLATAVFAEDEVHWYENGQMHSFGDAQLIGLSNGNWSSIHGCDFDGDGVDDLIVQLGGGVGWLRGLGAASFAPEVALLPQGSFPSSGVGVLDMDNDGDLDLMGSGFFTLNSGGAFGPISACPGGAVSDVYGDGFVDLMTHDDCAVYYSAFDGVSFLPPSVRSSYDCTGASNGGFLEYIQDVYFGGFGTSDGSRYVTITDDNYGAYYYSNLNEACSNWNGICFIDASMSGTVIGGYFVHPPSYAMYSPHNLEMVGFTWWHGSVGGADFDLDGIQEPVGSKFSGSSEYSGILDGLYCGLGLDQPLQWFDQSQGIGQRTFMDLDNDGDQDLLALGTDGQFYWHDNLLNPVDCDGDGIGDQYQIESAPYLDWNGDGVLDSCSPATYCYSNPNVTGLLGEISLSGSPLIGNNSFTLYGTSLPPNEFGYFLFSQFQAAVDPFGGGAGVLCLGSPVKRFSQFVLGTGTSGSVSLQPDLLNLPGGVVLEPGAVWNFQLWHRETDPATNMSSSNTTDAITVMFR